MSTGNSTDTCRRDRHWKTHSYFGTLLRVPGMRKTNDPRKSLL
jgi:hypothetical protein